MDLGVAHDFQAIPAGCRASIRGQDYGDLNPIYKTEQNGKARMKICNVS